VLDGGFSSHPSSSQDHGMGLAAVIQASLHRTVAQGRDPSPCPATALHRGTGPAHRLILQMRSKTTNLFMYEHMLFFEIFEIFVSTRH